MSIAEFANEIGRPYAAVLKAAHSIGIETPRGKKQQRMLKAGEMQQLRKLLKQPPLKKAEKKA